MSALPHIARNAIVFGRALRRHGLRAQPDRTIALAQALAAVGFERRDDVRSATRCVLAQSPEEATLVDLAFDAVWRAGDDLPVDDGPPDGEADADDGPDGGAARDAERGRNRAHEPEPATVRARRAQEPSHPATSAEATISPLPGDRSMTWSRHEALYQKDFSQFTRAELDATRDLTRARPWDFGRRRSRRSRSGHGATFDARRTLRDSLRREGELLSLASRRRRTKQRDVVLLCDVSGSMDRYSRLLLQFVHAVRQAAGRVEAFVFGTRLTRITRELRHREIQQALDAISVCVADWAGGTRIGECLHAFNEQWARRTLSRGAIVIIISDGWDRGDVHMLEREMQRLQRRSYRLVWLNPLLGSSAYRPQTVGMKVALPYVDDFLPANNLSSLVQMAQLLQAVGRRRPVRAQRVAVP